MADERKQELEAKVKEIQENLENLEKEKNVEDNFYAIKKIVIDYYAEERKKLNERFLGTRLLAAPDTVMYAHAALNELNLMEKTLLDCINLKFVGRFFSDPAFSYDKKFIYEKVLKANKLALE